MVTELLPDMDILSDSLTLGEEQGHLVVGVVDTRRVSQQDVDHKVRERDLVRCQLRLLGLSDLLHLRQLDRVA